MFTFVDCAPAEPPTVWFGACWVRPRELSPSKRRSIKAPVASQLLELSYAHNNCVARLMLLGPTG